MSNLEQINNILIPWAPIIGAFGGALITGLIALGINLNNKKSEERKHRQKLMVNAAIENWKEERSLALEKMTKNVDSKVMPLELYIIHLMKFFEIFDSGKLTDKNIILKLEELDKITKSASNYVINKHNKAN